MPRRPWRSLNSFSASPIRVPLDQSGAATAARWIARSGWREASARVSRVSRVAKANASACGPLPAGAGQELEVGAAVGLHRARDVAQHHEPAADGAPAAAREADRIAAGAQAGPQRPPHVDALAVAPALVAAGAPQRRGELQARHQPVELRELVRLERVEALAGEPLLVAGQRQRDVDLRPVGVVLARTRRRRRGRRLPELPLGRRAAGAVAAIGTRAVRRRARAPSAAAGAAEDRAEDRVEGLARGTGRTRTPSGRSSTAAGGCSAARA